MQTGSSQHVSDSASSSQQPEGRSPESRAGVSHQAGQVLESPFRAFAGSPPGASSSSPSGMPQADATVNVRVQRSFLAAAKHGRTASPQMRRSPMAGKGSSPNGMNMAYSASSEDVASTSGW